MITKIYNYHRLYFNFDFMNFSVDEKEFFDNYPNANKFLIRYFPINIIYFMTVNTFQDFINLIYTEQTQTCSVYWERKFLFDILDKVKENIDSKNFKFDPYFKCTYHNECYVNEKGC